MVLFVFGLITASYLAKPIIGLRDMANKISEGELNYRITDIPQTRELAELASDFNTMTENLTALINDLEQWVSERTTVTAKKTEQLPAASFMELQPSEAK